jgi:hypothetical protein
MDKREFELRCMEPPKTRQETKKDQKAKGNPEPYSTKHVRLSEKLKKPRMR